MLTLITGGCKCGKSSIAEDILSDFCGRKIYIATMEPFGAGSLCIAYVAEAVQMNAACDGYGYDRAADRKKHIACSKHAAEPLPAQHYRPDDRTYQREKAQSIPPVFLFPLDGRHGDT